MPPVVMKKKSRLYFPWIFYTYADKSFKYLMDFIIATTKVCECLLEKKIIHLKINQISISNNVKFIYTILYLHQVHHIANI